MSPISKPEILRDFYRHFLEGYRTENELDPFWIEQLGTFLSYRRLLLYTVLQGWLSNDRTANDAFLSMIKETTRDGVFGSNICPKWIHRGYTGGLG